MFASVCLWAPAAWAYSGGAPVAGCDGCHGSGEHNVLGVSSPGSINPGQEVTVTITILSGSGNEAGLFIESDAGTFDTIGGQGLAEVTAGLTHTSPKSLGGGSAEFSFRWTAPDRPGAVRFDISSVVANGNGNSGGDEADRHAVDFVFGCASQEYYRDHDGDGFGQNELPRLFCAGDTPTGYAANAGDCDDNRDTVYPDAVEYCNLRDDNCDGEVDEDALPVMQWPDADGDGYYGQEEGQSKETYLGCVPFDGFAAEPGDCRPEDPTINPGVEEICNGFDDNCDARVDEFVRPRCGEGWCRREADTCDPDTCVPGEPREEECNLFDDDCDGQLDEGSCPDGLTCVAAECLDEDEVDPPPDTGETGDSQGETGISPTSSGTGTGGTAPGSDSSSGADAASAGQRAAFGGRCSRSGSLVDDDRSNSRRCARRSSPSRHRARRCTRDL